MDEGGSFDSAPRGAPSKSALIAKLIQETQAEVDRLRALINDRQDAVADGGDVHRRPDFLEAMIRIYHSDL